MNLEAIKKLCDTDVNTLKKFLVKFLQKKGYSRIFNREDYIIAEGDIPICLVAHVDTVFSSYKNFYFLPDEMRWFYDSNQDLLWKAYGAGFDDRAGLYALIEIVKAGYRPHIIFTDEEEIGGIGAQSIIADFKSPPFFCSFLIQLDRRGGKDAVFYECDNENFTKYITSFDFEKMPGTFSDICFIAPAWKRAAVNLSIGFLDEHTESERLYCYLCDATIEKVKMILEDNKTNSKIYPFIRKKSYPLNQNNSLENNFDFDKKI